MELPRELVVYTLIFLDGKREKKAIVLGNITEYHTNHLPSLKLTAKIPEN